MGAGSLLVPSGHGVAQGRAEVLARVHAWPERSGWRQASKSERDAGSNTLCTVLLNDQGFFRHDGHQPAAVDGGEIATRGAPDELEADNSIEAILARSRRKELVARVRRWGSHGNGSRLEPAERKWQKLFVALPWLTFAAMVAFGTFVWTVQSEEELHLLIVSVFVPALRDLEGLLRKAEIPVSITALDLTASPHTKCVQEAVAPHIQLILPRSMDGEATLFRSCYQEELPAHKRSLSLPPRPSKACVEGDAELHTATPSPSEKKVVGEHVPIIIGNAATFFGPAILAGVQGLAGPRAPEISAEDISRLENGIQKLRDLIFEMLFLQEVPLPDVDRKDRSAIAAAEKKRWQAVYQAEQEIESGGGCPKKYADVSLLLLCIGANSSLFRFIAVFYHELGLSNWQIGILQTLHPWMTFLGSLVWAAICDATGAYKPILLVSNFCGALVMCSLQAASEGQFTRVCASVALGSFMLSARAGLLDALTLKVVEEYRSRAAGAEGGNVPSYGQQRLWGSAGFGLFALLSGCAMGRIGSSGMFLIFLFCLLMTVVLVLTQLPARGTRAEPPPAASQDPGSLCRFDVWWFFSNLLVYGAHMALVESFLFVYLSADFVGASKQLLGASVSVMCIFEVPVYLLIQRLIDRFPLTLLLSCCHVIFAFRVFAYSILPEDRPYFVLFIEPLHGATMAAMWACSVELGRRLAPEGARARMQALVAGIYYRVASGAGSLLWGHLTQQPPLGYGFQAMYRLASVTILSWCIIWNVGWCLRSGRNAQPTAYRPLPDRASA
ncbi:malA [Symbiodinium microadriaticum]|nr:malA [Symbiodinium microadriaticum]